MNNINNFLYPFTVKYFETKIVANGALDPFINLLYSSPENKFSITGELTAPWVKSWFILYYKIFGMNKEKYKFCF